MSVTIKFKRLVADAILPSYAHEGDSGMRVEFSKMGIVYFRMKPVNEKHARFMLFNAFVKCNGIGPEQEDYERFLRGEPVTKWGRTFRVVGAAPRQMEMDL